MANVIEQEYVVDREIGSYLKILEKWRKAIHYSERARNYVPKAIKVLGVDAEIPMETRLKLIFLTVYRNLCDYEKALEILKSETPVNDTRLNKVKLEEYMMDYEMSKLEMAKFEFLNASRYFAEKNRTTFFDKSESASENIRDCLGDSFDRFIIEHRNIVDKIQEEKLQMQNVDDRPLWKLRRELKECDILSIPEKEEINESPCNKKRRFEKQILFYQTYFRNSWKDVIFYKNLPKQKDFVLPAFVESAGKLNELKKDFNIVAKVANMLHARAPMYYFSHKRFINLTQKKHCHEVYLFWKQYQTRRQAFEILRTARDLRAKLELKKLSAFVRESMYEVILCKTFRLLPWKIELVNEVYQILGLAYADNLISKINTHTNERGIHKMFTLLQLHDNSGIVKKPKLNFLDRSTFVTVKLSSEQERKVEQAFLSRTLSHITHSKHAIERCALYHEIGLHFLNKNRPIEALVYGKEALKEVKHVTRNYLWLLLSYVLILKAYTINRKIEMLSKVLQVLLKITDRLKSPNICAFLQVCQEHVRYEQDILEIRKREKNLFSSRRRLTKSDDSLSPTVFRDSEPSNE